MTGWERLARALVPGASKHIDHWNEQVLHELNADALIKARTEVRRVLGARAADFILWDLEMEEEDA